VPAYGEVRIEGFRTSLADVATFRFSSVDNSYAGQKGKSRNVGVIAVAIFEEQARPADTQIIVPEVTRRPYHWTDDVDAEASAAPRDRGGGRVAQHKGKADKRAAEAPAAESRSAPPPRVGSTATGAAAGAPSAAPRHHATEDYGGDYYEPAPPTTTAAPKTNRPGLGTEFGESRYSAASYTRFVRASDRPIAVAELRYNDTAGLKALGILVEPEPDSDELMTRETADPFPGDRGFARPPAGIR
jgi:hypothetical protein